VTHPPAKREGAAHVAVTPGRRQPGLRRAVSRSAQHAPDRQPEGAAQVVGLVEAALERSIGVQGHRHDGVGPREEVGAGVPHQGAKRGGQHAPALVLEGMHDRAQRTFVAAGAARQREHRRLPAASRTARVGRAPVIQGIAAARAERR